MDADTPKRRIRFVSGLVVLTLIIVVGGTLWYQHQKQLIIKAQEYQKYQNLMALTSLQGTSSAPHAPNFTLKDQNGKMISLSSLQVLLLALFVGEIPTVIVGWNSWFVLTKMAEGSTSTQRRRPPCLTTFRFGQHKFLSDTG